MRGFKVINRGRDKNYKWKFIFILAIPLSFLIKWLMSLNPEFTEIYYSQGLYKYIMQPVSRLTGLLPFSLAEVLIILLIIYVIVSLVYITVKIIKTGKWTTLFRFLANVVLIGSIWFFIQTVVWTVNYERLSFAENSGLNIRDSSVDELESLCLALINNTNELREKVLFDYSGVMKIDGGFRSVSERAQTAFSELEKSYPFLIGNYGPPKPILLSRLMSHTNIIGIYSCLTGEANVDVDIPHIELASTALHEMAHQRGFAREDEANYIAYIACMSHTDVDFKYSGSVMALQYSMNALYAEDNERYFRLTEKYSPGYLKDLKHQQNYWKKFQGVTRKVADKVNDTYLKLNGQADGVKSYGRMVDLLLAEYRNQLIPSE